MKFLGVALAYALLIVAAIFALSGCGTYLSVQWPPLIGPVVSAKFPDAPTPSPTPIK